jgi:hypothetical protein
MGRCPVPNPGSRTISTSCNSCRVDVRDLAGRAEAAVLVETSRLRVVSLDVQDEPGVGREPGQAGLEQAVAEALSCASGRT